MQGSAVTNIWNIWVYHLLKTIHLNISVFLLTSVGSDTGLELGAIVRSSKAFELRLIAIGFSVGLLLDGAAVIGAFVGSY